MKKTFLLEPNGWPCALTECPPGPFLCDGELSFKSEPGADGQIRVFNGTGQTLWAGTGSFAEVCKIVVQPVMMLKG